MKRGFTILLLLLTTTCRAQNSPEVSNLSLTDSSLRILYIGVDNYLQITGIKKPEDLEVTIWEEQQISGSMKHPGMLSGPV